MSFRNTSCTLDRIYSNNTWRLEALQQAFGRVTKYGTMVQYIVTPWRDHKELISVREHLYPGDQPPSSSTSGDLSDSLPWSVVYAASSLTSVSRAEADQRLAVGRVQMWAHRGNCPHLVESTGLLVAVVLDDVNQSRRQRSERPASSSLSDFAVRAAYATAFSRYVSCFPAVSLVRGRARMHTPYHYEQ